MATMWDDAARRELLERFGRLTPDHRPRWGKMNAAQMLAHLNDTHRMASGEIRPAFGRMSYGDWGALMHKHVSHHFAQFRV
jgi:hypothetical protein